MSRLLHWRSLAIAWQIAILGAIVAAALFLRTPQVSGFSMSPQIRSGEYVLIDTFAYRFHGPARGDIVAFHHDSANGELFIKRVIGIAGDRIRIERGVVYRNGRRLDEPYVRYPDHRSFPEVTVPPHAVYVLGDNRAASEDSRAFGAVPDALLVGKALAGIWPPRALGRL